MLKATLRKHLPAVAISIGALIAATPALAATQHVLLEVPAAGTLPANLASTVSEWRQSGFVTDATWLEENQHNASDFNTFVELDFSSEQDYQKWAASQRAKLPAGVQVFPATGLLHNEVYPRDSNHSVFTVATLPASAKPDIAALTATLEKQRRDKTVMRYTLYHSKDANGGSWLMTEYRDATAYARGSGVGAELASKLSGTVTKTRYVELPAPELADLPSYKPEVKLNGTLRIYGSSLKNSVEYLARAFNEYHPDLRVAWNISTSSEGAIAGLYTGISDIAPSGDDAKLTDEMPFFNVTGYLPTEISVATGGYEKRGSLWAWVIVVNKDNPLKSISIDELQNIFGEERTGGWDIEHNDILFTAAYAKSKESNIRTWDQVGLSGPYKGKEIQTYGYSAPGFQQAFERHWFHWSHKWNPNLKEYVEAKMAIAGPNGEIVKSERPLEILSKDKFGIGIAGQMHVKDYPNLKVLPLSWHKGGPIIEFTPQTVANRSYPLAREGYFYINKIPGRPLDPAVREFMRFVLSREGQQVITKVNYYYPLDAKTIAEQRKKLDN